MPILHTASIHEKKFIAHFGSAGLRPGRRHPEERPRTYVLCFTNRCGSNLLAELIATNPAFGRANEYLNADGVIKIAAEKNFKTLHQYLGWLQKTKSSPDGVLGQAVSHVIAAQTKEWTSKQTGKLDENEIAFRRVQIVRVMDAIHEANAKFSCFFDAYGIRPVNVTYENLVLGLQSEGDRVVRETGFAGADAAVSPASVTLSKQRNQLNEAFAARIRETYDSYRSAAAERQNADVGKCS